MRRGIMLCYPLELSRLEKWLAEDGFVICQPKLDGDRGRALLGESVSLLSSEETDRRFSLPHIKEELEKAKSIFHSRGIYELDGEFYAHSMEHEDIHSICSRSTNLHPDYLKIEYHVFDHVALQISQFDRLEALYDARDAMDNNYVRFVESAVVNSVEKVFEFYHGFVNFGYEGIICRRRNYPYRRKRSPWIMKFKPKRWDVYVIIGTKEEISKDGIPKNRLGAFVLTDDEGNVFSVSAGLDDQDREKYWELRDSLPGRKCKVYYQATTKYGVPKFATDLEVLGEQDA